MYIPRTLGKGWRGQKSPDMRDSAKGLERVEVGVEEVDKASSRKDE